MPRFNGTGPQGRGPGTGLGLGPCEGGARRYPGWWSIRRYWPGKKLSPEEERQALDEEEKALQQELSAVQKRRSALADPGLQDQERKVV